MNASNSVFRSMLYHTRKSSYTKQSIFKIKESEYHIHLFTAAEIQSMFAVLPTARDKLIFKLLIQSGARIFCSDCGAAMTFNNRDFGNGRHGEFVCGTYKRKGKEHCTTHYVTYDGVYQMLLQDIRAKARAAQQNEARFMQSLEQESHYIAVRQSSLLLKDEQQARQRVAQLDQIISKGHCRAAVATEDVACEHVRLAAFTLPFAGAKPLMGQIPKRLRDDSVVRSLGYNPLPSS